jgi:hypothetical protein
VVTFPCLGLCSSGIINKVMVQLFRGGDSRTRIPGSDAASLAGVSEDPEFDCRRYCNASVPFQNRLSTAPSGFRVAPTP